MAKTLIHRPVISEKSISQGTVNKYTFVVDKSASKPLIADAIAKLFKVTVEDVRIINQRGMRVLVYREVLTSKHRPVKGLVRGAKRGSGRNSRGVITSQRRGGGAKQ